MSYNIEASNLWAFFQAKNIRQTTLRTAADQLGVTATSEAAKKQIETWKKTAERYEDEAETREGRKQLYRLLDANHYDICGMICSGEPIMTKWKWVLAARLPAKLFVLNENGDYFFADRSNLGIIQHFFLYRAGLTGAGAVATLLRLALFPLTLTYLLLYAATAHLGRRVRT